MKALTVKQPWASLIVDGIKDIENRTWKTNYRGRIFIHAAATPVDGPACDALSAIQFSVVFDRNRLDALNGPNGVVIGSVEVVDCVEYHPSIWAERKAFPTDKPIYNWVLANAVKFIRPIQAKGKLSLWDLKL